MFLEKQPTMIQIESSTRCDASCYMCPHSNLKRKSGSMSTRIFHKIVKEMKEFPNLKHILLFLNGEPLIFSRLYSWLQHLRKNEMTTVIFTNANALTEAKAKKLLSFSDVITQIVISVNGDKETMQANCGLKYDRIVKNVKTLMRLNKLNDNPIPVSAAMAMSSRTKEIAPAFLEEWSQITDTAGTTSFFNFAGMVHDPLELKEGENHRKFPCGRLNHITVLWDGRACLCCMDAEGKVILGDVNKQSLQEIWLSEKAQDYRSMHNRGLWDKLPLCKDCNMNILCKNAEEQVESKDSF